MKQIDLQLVSKRTEDVCQPNIIREAILQCGSICGKTSMKIKLKSVNKGNFKKKHQDNSSETSGTAYNL